MFADAGQRQAGFETRAAEAERQQRHLRALAGFRLQRREPAAAVEMRVIEQLLRLDDRGVRQAVRLEEVLELAGRISAQHVLQPRDQPFAGEYALIVGGDRRIGAEVLQAEDLAENLPLRVADHPEEDLVAAFGFEYVVDAPGRDP